MICDELGNALKISRENAKRIRRIMAGTQSLPCRDKNAEWRVTPYKNLKGKRRKEENAVWVIRSQIKSENACVIDFFLFHLKGEGIGFKKTQ